MKITVEDTSMVNWDRVGERIREEITATVLRVLKEAQDVLSELQPGQRKTLPIKVGSVTIARPK